MNVKSTGEGVSDVPYTANGSTKERDRLPQIHFRQNHVESVDFSKNLEFSESYSGEVVSHSINGIKLSMNNMTPTKIPVKFVTREKDPEKSAAQKPVMRKMSTLNEIKEALNPSALLKTKSAAPVTMVYNIWPGNNRFYCKGRLMTGPATDRTSIFITWAGILVIGIVYFSVAAPFLWQNVTPYLPLLTTYLFIVTIVSLILTSFTDPGIIPRKSIFMAIQREIPDRFARRQSTTANTLITTLPNEQRNTERLQKIRYCKTCQIYCPAKTAHCSECNNCIEMKDSHCSFVNNCIGKRNYRFFVLFLCAIVLLGLSELAGFILLAVLRITDYEPKDDDEMKQSTVVIVLICLLTVPAVILTCGIGCICWISASTIVKDRKVIQNLSREGRVSENIERLRDPSAAAQWCRSHPSNFDPRHILTMDQLGALNAQRISVDETEGVESEPANQRITLATHSPTNRSRARV